MNDIEQLKKLSIMEMGLSIRACNVLRYSKIYCLGDLLEKTIDEVLRFPHMGRSSLNEIAEKLSSYGLSLKVQ